MFEQAINDQMDSSQPLKFSTQPMRQKKDFGSQRMQNLFSGNTDWEDYIDNPEKGKYGFRRD